MVSLFDQTWGGSHMSKKLLYNYLCGVFESVSVFFAALTYDRGPILSAWHKNKGVFASVVFGPHASCSFHTATPRPPS